MSVLFHFGYSNLPRLSKFVALGRQLNRYSFCMKQLTLCSTSISFAQPKSEWTPVKKLSTGSVVFRLGRRKKVRSDVAGERREEGVVFIADIDATATK
jgi:hypothetical protein